MHNIKTMKGKFTYSYQKYPRTQITTTIRSDLRKKLKDLSYSSHQYETKILDILLQELFNKNNKEMELFIEQVREYF